MVAALRTLRGRLLLLLALALLPPGLFALMQAVSSYTQARAIYQRSVLQEAVLAIGSLTALISDTRKILGDLAAQPEIKGFDETRCSRLLASAHDQMPRLGLVSAVDATGSVRCLSRNLEIRGKASDWPWYEAMVADPRFFITPALDARITGKRSVFMGNPMFDDTGAYAGFVGASVPTSLLEAELRRLETSQGTRLALVDPEGNLIASDTDDATWVPPPSLVRYYLGGAETVFELDDGESAHIDFAVSPLYENQVYALAGALPPHPLAGLSLGLAINIALPTIMWAAALVVAWYGIDRYVVRWVVQLRRIAQAYSKGRLSLRAIAMESAPLELKQLGDTMNEMAATLDERAERLRAAIAEQQALLAEVHHRVRNNLQLMSSLLNLQHQRAETQAERDSLRVVQERIQALALVHRGLYETGGLHRLELPSLVPEIVRFVQHGRNSAAQAIKFGFDIGEIAIDANKAVPLALLVTEAVSDALDRAARGKGRGSITIRIAEDAEGCDIVIAMEGSSEAIHAWTGMTRLLVEAFAQQLKGMATFSAHGASGQIVVRTERLSIDAGGQAPGIPVAAVVREGRSNQTPAPMSALSGAGT